MSAARFFDDDAKARVKSVVAAVELETGAEVVVTVRARSWRYRHTHYLVGFVTALLVLAVLLFHPLPFDVDFWPLELTLAFVIGTALTMVVPPLERLLTARHLMQTQVHRAAKAAFVDLGVSRTSARTGLLIYVSLGERLAALVPDVGLADARSSEAFTRAEKAIERATARADFDAFLAGLAELGEPLAALAPRRADDVNELPDEVA